MGTFLWILIFGLLMSAIALIGGLTFFIQEEVWRKMILPLVAFAAGALIGGAIFHMIPAAVEQMGNGTALYCWLAGGYMLFYALEEFLHWHHSHTHAHHEHRLHHHSHHNECSHHQNEFQNHAESRLLVCSHRCYTHRGLAPSESKKACTASDKSAAENHRMDTNTTEPIVQGVPVLRQSDEEWPKNVGGGDASCLPDTSSCTGDFNAMGNCDYHHDLEEGGEILKNDLNTLKTQQDEEHSLEHSITMQTVIQENNDACHTSCNNTNERDQHFASTQHSSHHQQQDISNEMTPVIAYLIIIADAVHNFLGGLFVGASFVDSTSLGISAWIAAAAHEIPQELGDFAVLRHGGWSRQKALFFNFLSALTFPLGGIIAFAASKHIEVSFLIPFAAGNFLYIGGSDLIPEVKHSRGTKQNFIHFVSCSVGVGLMVLIRILVNGW